MSHVTNVIVHVDYAPEEVERLLESPFPFEEARKGVGLKRMSDIYERVGGSKVFEGDIYAGAFNYLDVSAMVDWFVSLPWGGVGSAVLSSSTEGSYWRVIIVRDERIELVEPVQTAKLGRK